MLYNNIQHDEEDLGQLAALFLSSLFFSVAYVTRSSSSVGFFQKQSDWRKIRVQVLSAEVGHLKKLYSSKPRQVDIDV